MRTGAAVLLAAVSLTGCEVAPDYPEHDHLLPSDEQVSYFQVKARLLNDVRIWRELDRHLDRGRKEPGIPGSAEFRLQELEAFVLRDDPKEQRDAVTEMAFYSPSAGTYFYHYVGGPNSLDVWMGPYSLTPSKRK